MSTDILDRLQENKLVALEELLDARHAVTPPDNEELATIADFIVDEGIGLRQGLLRLWDYHWTLALAGKIANRPDQGAKLRTLLERGGRALSRGAATARSYAELSGREVARLSGFEEQARAFPVWVEERMACWELLDRSHGPLDRARVARSQEDFERGECEEVADILARLQQGGS